MILTLLLLPNEILEQILIFCNVPDVVAFARTCRTAYKLLSSTTLWREVLLTRFDDPQSSVFLPVRVTREVNWKALIMSRTHAQHCPMEHLPDLVCVLDEAIYTSIEGPSHSLAWLNSVLAKWKMHPGLQAYDEILVRSPHLSRLNCILDVIPRALTSSNPLLSRALRCQAFDPSVMLPPIFFGPFEDPRKSTHASNDKALGDKNTNKLYSTKYLEGPTIRWLQLEAATHTIYRVLCCTIDLRNNAKWPSLLRPPHKAESMRAGSATGLRRRKDWAGIEGSWVRVVGMMDFECVASFDKSDS